LLFYNARWYDPVSGRFSQADTITLIPPKDAEHSNFFIALTVDFHENEILKYLNAVNNRNALDNDIESTDKDKHYYKQNVSKDDSSRRETADLRKSLQLEDRFTSYTQDETVEKIGALNKIGKASQPNEKSKTKIFAENKDLSFDLAYANQLDRYSYVRNCPLRYTDPSGHEAKCPKAILGGAAIFDGMMIPEAAVGVGMILAFPEPAAPVVEPVLALIELKFIYLSGIGVEMFHQGQTRSCEEIQINPDPRNWFK
jgi:hypothetical protein